MTSETKEKFKQIARNAVDLLIWLLIPGPIVVIVIDTTINDRPYFESVEMFQQEYMLEVFLAVLLILGVWIAIDVFRKFFLQK